MPNVSVNILNRNYTLNCPEGQESHLQSTAKLLNTRLDDLKHQTGSDNDMLVVLITALTLQDELQEAQKKSGGQPAQPQSDNSENIDAAVTDAVTKVAEYVESLAIRMEKTYK